MEVLDGAGVTGGSIGITTMPGSTTAGITPGAERFTTGALLPEEQAGVVDLTARGAELVHAGTRGTGLVTGGLAAEFTTVRVQRLGLSTETGRLLGDTPNREARVGPARAPSAATTMADRREAFLHAEAPAWVAEGRVAAVAGIDHQFPVRFLVVGKT